MPKANNVLIIHEDTLKDIYNCGVAYEQQHISYEVQTYQPATNYQHRHHCFPDQQFLLHTSVQILTIKAFAPLFTYIISGWRQSVHVAGIKTNSVLRFPKHLQHHTSAGP